MVFKTIETPHTIYLKFWVVAVVVKVDGIFFPIISREESLTSYTGTS